MSETCQKLAFTHPIVVLKSGLKNNWMKKLDCVNRPSVRLEEWFVCSIKRVICSFAWQTFWMLYIQHSSTSSNICEQRLRQRGLLHWHRNKQMFNKTLCYRLARLSLFAEDDCETIFCKYKRPLWHIFYINVVNTPLLIARIKLMW